MSSFTSSRRLFKNRRQGSLTTAMSKPKSKLPSVGWTGPGLARRQCSDWLPQRNSGEYAPLPKLSPTSDALPVVKAKVLYDDTNDSGSDMGRGKVKGMYGGIQGLYDASGEEITSDSDDEAIRKLRNPMSVMAFPQKSPVSANGATITATSESQRAAQRLAKLSSPEGPSEGATWRVVPSSSGSANGRSSSSTSGNLISFKEEAGSEELLFGGTTSQEADKVTSATSKLISTASSPLSPTSSPTTSPFPPHLAVNKSRPQSHQDFLLDDWQKSVRPRTSLEAIRQQIRQIECEIVCSQAEQDFYSGHTTHHDYPSSRPIQASYSSQSIPATFDSKGGPSRLSYPCGMQRAYSVDVAVQSAISDIQSAVRHNSQIKLKGSSQSNLNEGGGSKKMSSPHALWSARAATQASIHEENDSVWVKRDVKMPEVPTAEGVEDDSGSTALIMNSSSNSNGHVDDEAGINESMQLLSTDSGMHTGGQFHHNHQRIGQLNQRPLVSRKVSSCQEAAHELVEGLLFRCCYLGSTHLFSDSRPTKASRLTQAQEAVTRIKAPEGESQPMSDVDLFISIDKIMVLNADIQDVLMDHPLRTISYIADIGDLVVLMVKRGLEDLNCDAVLRSSQPRMLCHVFQSDEASVIAQTIGNAFQVAYMEYLKANGVQDDRYLRHLDYLEVLNSQEMSTNELDLFASKEKQVNVVIPKTKGEMLGVVIVESGWGSMLPTVIIANLCPTGPAARCAKLSIGDQLISIDGISLVGLPLAHCQTIIKNVRNHTVVKLTVVSCPPVVEVRIKRPDTRYQLGFSVQNGIICSLLRGGIAERGGIRVGHRIIEINGQSVVATNHDSIVNMLAHSAGEIELKTMPSSIFRLLTGQDIPVYI